MGTTRMNDAIEAWITSRLTAVDPQVFNACRGDDQRRFVIAVALPFGFTVEGGHYGTALDLGYIFYITSKRGNTVRVAITTTSRGCFVSC